jgi:hypothetical protein
MASTSAREIGFAATAAAGVTEGAAALVDEGEDGGAVAPVEEGTDEDGGAVAPVEEGADEDGVAAGVTPAACFEPKIADTMLPKTLILSSCLCLSLATTVRRPPSFSPCHFDEGRGGCEFRSAISATKLALKANLI